jgi:hypothetical protein
MSDIARTYGVAHTTIMMSLSVAKVDAICLTLLDR